MLDYFYKQGYLNLYFLNCFSTIKGAKNLKGHFMNISLVFIIALVPPWRHSNKEKCQEDLENGIMGALEIANQNNHLTIAFPPLGNGVFSFSIDLCATIILQTMRDFINKNSNSSLEVIRVVVNNARQVKAFARIMMASTL